MKKVYVVWKTDFVEGRDWLQSVHLTEEGAEAEVKKLDKKAKINPEDSPYYWEEHEIKE